MNFRFSENTKVTINLGLLVAVLVFLITATIAATDWKSGIEGRVSAVEVHTRAVRDEIKLEHEVMDDIIERQYEQDALFAEIRTDLKWIRAAMEDD